MKKFLWQWILLAKTELTRSIEHRMAPNTDTSAGSRKTVIGSYRIAEFPDVMGVLGGTSI